MKPFYLYLCITIKKTNTIMKKVKKNTLTLVDLKDVKIKMALKKARLSLREQALAYSKNK